MFRAERVVKASAWQDFRGQPEAGGTWERWAALNSSQAGQCIDSGICPPNPFLSSSVFVLSCVKNVSLSLSLCVCVFELGNCQYALKLFGRFVSAPQVFYRILEHLQCCVDIDFSHS